MVEAIVQLQINAGFIAQEEKEEYVQFIIDEFLTRLKSIRRQYNSSALLKTYCAAIFRNLCKDRIRLSKRGGEFRMLRETDLISYGYASPLNELAIKQEVEIFGKIFSLFARKRTKAQLFIKAYLRIEIEQGDLMAYCPGVRPLEAKRWVERISLCSEVYDNELYVVLSQLSLRVEGKVRSSDSVRKWIRARLNDLVDLMNKSRDTLHNEETIQLLAERYFSSDQNESVQLKKERLSKR